MSKRKSLGTVNAVLGYVNPQYHAEVVGNLSSRAASMQARLDAIEAIAKKDGDLLDLDDLNAIEVLARGTPAREVRAALKRYGRKAK